MKLSKVAIKFDKTVASDAYTPATTFLCQLAPLELFKIEGAAIKRRQMSCSPSVTIPTRKVISIDAENYLVGDGSPDQWNGQNIRMNYVIQGADALAGITSIAAELAGTAATQAYVALVFSRYLPDGADSSKYPPQYQVFLSGTESAPADSLIHVGSKWYLVKDSYIGLSGLLLALANEIKGTVFETISAGSRTYVPSSDSYTSTPITVKLLRVKWTEHFTYLSKAQISYERGDEQVFILKAAMTPKPNDTLTLSDGTWRIMDVQSEGTTWSCHVRR